MTLKRLLTRFRSLDGSGPFDYEWCFHHDGGESEAHLVVGAIIHGDEVGSVPAVVDLAERLATASVSYGGRLTLVLGNPEASLKNRRFLDYDLNRVFTDSPPNGHEGDRSLALKPILRTADVFLDLHQTIQPTTSAFYTFPFDRDGWKWARLIGNAPIWVTRAPGAGFSRDSCCADEFVRSLGKTGLTLELGHKGFSASATEKTTAVLQRLLLATAQWNGDLTAIEAMAGTQPDFNFIETSYAHPFSDPTLRLKDGIRNLAPVKEGELLSAEGSTAIEAPIEGYILFPKYPTYQNGSATMPRPNELFQIATTMSEHPEQRWLADS